MVSIEREHLDPSMRQKEKFLELMERYEPALRRLTSVYMQTAADQDDLFQEIAIAIWTAIPRFLTITKEGDRLMAQATGQPKLELFPQSETEFFFRVVDARVTFAQNEKGETTTLDPSPKRRSSCLKVQIRRLHQMLQGTDCCDGRITISGGVLQRFQSSLSTPSTPSR
jgi:hypothetical protein